MIVFPGAVMTPVNHPNKYGKRARRFILREVGP